MFINNFKYKIGKAKIIKILYKHGNLIQGKDYENKVHNSPFLGDPFGFQSSSSFRVYDKHDSFGDYREVTHWLYDYMIVVEYTYNNITYQEKITIENTSRYLNENKTVKVYFERKNPSNVFLKPVLEFF